MTHTLFLIYAGIYDLFVMLEEKLTITLHIVQWNLNYPDLDYPNLFPWSRCSFFFLMNITRCDLEKLKQKFITPSKREFKTLFLICFALNKREQHKMNNYSDAFS